MANIDVDLTSSVYDESDFNNCVCIVDSVAGTVTAGPIPDPLEDLFLRDIYFDVAAAVGANYFVTRAGDWLLVDQDEALRQSLLRDFLGDPGEWVTNPTWGAGGRSYVKSKRTKTNRDTFANRLRARALADKRVAKVADVQIEDFADGGVKFQVVIEKKSELQRAKNLVVVSFDSRTGG